MKRPFFGQTLWQWVGQILSVLMGAMVVWLIYRWEYRRKALESERISPWRFGKLLFPASGMALAWAIEIFIDLQLNKPFTTGNYIILDSGEGGEVVEIGLRSTRILTRDEILIRPDTLQLLNGGNSGDHFAPTFSHHTLLP